MFSMDQAIEFRAEIREDHILRVPAEVPAGPVKVIMIIESPAARPMPRDVAAARQAAMGMDNASGSVVPDDFDAPLPPEVQRYFEGEDDEDPGLSQRGPLWVA